MSADQAGEYAPFPNHPLRPVPQVVLDAARSALDGAVEWKDVDPDMAHPIADAVVVALLPWLICREGVRDLVAEAIMRHQYPSYRGEPTHGQCDIADAVLAALSGSYEHPEVTP